MGDEAVMNKRRKHCPDCGSSSVIAMGVPIGNILHVYVTCSWCGLLLRKAVVTREGEVRIIYRATVEEGTPWGSQSRRRLKDARLD